MNNCDCSKEHWLYNVYMYKTVLVYKTMLVRIRLCRDSEASIPPETVMHFPPVSDFPPIFEKFSDSVGNF